MSELTLCNWHTLQDIKRQAAKRGAEVILSWDKGWIAARYSDQDKPSAWFLELTEGCVC